MVLKNICGSMNIESILRYIEWRFDGSDAPDDNDLRMLGIHVLEEAVMSNSWMLGGMDVSFRVYHAGKRVVPPGLRDGILTGLTGGDDDLCLYATIRLKPTERDVVEGEDDKVRQAEEIPLYVGNDFRAMWAVWRSWTTAADFLANDWSERRKENMAANGPETSGKETADDRHGQD